MNRILHRWSIKFLIFIVFQVFALSLYAQETPKLFNVEFHGFVNHEIIFDTRQVVTAREGEVLVFPAEEILDPDGNDINARQNLNFFAFSSRLQTKITGPDAFGAKTSALVEVDFLGTTNDKFNLLRMRHAYLQLNWAKTELVAGQTWHPMFIAACFPMVVNFGGSLPYHVLSRAPMLKLTYKPGKLAMTGYVLTQSDFPTSGPQGASSVYLRNSGLPEFYGQMMYSSPSLLLGATAGYMVLHPELKTSTGYRNDASISALTANVFGKLSMTSFTLRTQGIYSDNANHLVMLGGFGETEITDALTGERGYSNISTMSVWADIETNGPKYKVGFFAGYSEKLGSEKEITGRSWIRGGNISHIYRLGPRLIIVSGKLAWGLEVFYDVAAYGAPDNKFRFTETKDVANVRLLSSLRYNF